MIKSDEEQFEDSGVVVVLSDLVLDDLVVPVVILVERQLYALLDVAVKQIYLALFLLRQPQNGARAHRYLLLDDVHVEVAGG